MEASSFKTIIMKIHFFMLVGTALPLVGFGQTQAPKQQKPVTVQTEHVHRGASHYHTRATNVPTEHHSTTTWHYHSGAKRPQVPVQGTEQIATPKKMPGDIKENGK